MSATKVLAFGACLLVAGCASTSDINLSKVQPACGQQCSANYSQCLGSFTFYPNHGATHMHRRPADLRAGLSGTVRPAQRHPMTGAVEWRTSPLIRANPAFTGSISATARLRSRLGETACGGSAGVRTRRHREP